MMKTMFGDRSVEQTAACGRRTMDRKRLRFLMRSSLFGRN
jgi:hypothetical protein